MKKTLQIAQREFLATVMTKGFLFGLLIMPLMIGLMVLILPRLLQNKSPHVEGEIAIVDSSGAVLPRARAQLAPQAFAERRRAMIERLDAVMSGTVRSVAQSELVTAEIDQGLDEYLGEVPALRIVELPAGADFEAEKGKLTQDKAADGSKRLALIRVHDQAVGDRSTQDFGSYDLFVRAKLDDRLLDELREAMKASIIEARLAARDLDAKQIRKLTQVPYVQPLTVDASGERKTNEIAGRLLPMAFMVLMLLATMTAGQQLVTSTIEEKSSRVVEVLLAAVSPTQLMAGKILGQLGVGLLMMLLYGGLGVLALFTFAAMGLLDPWLLVYLLIFFLIAFMVLASLMAAIGAAVNELREAQALMTPVLLAVMLPMMLWLPISRDPNSTFATVLSLVPPVNPFVMVLRMSSSSPPPMWQVWLSIAIGIASVYAAIWFAAKVFRIGLLMHGKPPNFATLWRWVRMA